jgi:hypothetical protein
MVNLACTLKQYGTFPGGDSISVPIDANIFVELCSPVLCSYLLRMYPLLSSSRNRAVKCRLHRRSLELVSTGERDHN